VGKDTINASVTRPKGEKIARAKNSLAIQRDKLRRGGWPARRSLGEGWGGRRAGASEAEGRANQMKFDIFRKPPASKEKKAVAR